MFLNSAPTRRWFRISLRRILFWDIPYFALLTATLLPLRHLRPMTTWFTFDWPQRLGEAIAIGAVYEQATALTVAWLAIPIIARVALRVWLPSTRPPARLGPDNVGFDKMGENAPSMFRVWIRALAYLSVVGGLWVVVIPGAILAAERGNWWPMMRPPLIALAGGGLFAIGFGLACWAGVYLVQYGRGTPFPLDPPRRLVVCGPYRHVRNPQAIAMMLIVLGEVIAVDSRALWLMLPATLAYLELLAGPWEERQLTRDFGARYYGYASRVKKWIPYGKRLNP